MSVSMLLLIAGAQALVLLPAPCVRPAAQRAAHPRMQMRNPFENMANPFEQLGNPFEALLAAAAAAAPVAAPKVVSSTPKSAAAAVALLTSAAETKAEDSQAVIDALLKLEKTMRAEAKTEPRISAATLAALDGAWRLVFTTGTIDTQKKIGGTISYFPFKAVQTFDTSTSPMSITNGIYVGDYPVVQFFGPFEWKEAPRKLTFDFDYISLLGLKLKLPKGGAAKIGAASGLGADSNVARAERELPAFFNWISANADIATARGGGGGLALWRRDPEAQARMREDASEAEA